MTVDSVLYSCGKAGLSLHSKPQAEFKKVKALSNVVYIACGLNAVGAIAREQAHDKVHMWGDNTFGLLGRDPSKLKSSLEPVEVPVMTNDG